MYSICVGYTRSFLSNNETDPWRVRHPTRGLLILFVDADVDASDRIGPIAIYGIFIGKIYSPLSLFVPDDGSREPPREGQLPGSSEAGKPFHLHLSEEAASNLFHC